MDALTALALRDTLLELVRLLLVVAGVLGVALILMETRPRDGRGPHRPIW